MRTDPSTFSTVPLRPPSQVMRLDRLGSFHQCRLSFMRTLLRRLKQDQWKFKRTTFNLDASGVGVAVYSALGPERTYSLVCFAHDLPPEKRSDRVIADAWDATFALFDGIPSEGDIARLSKNVPKQEAGRITTNEICLSRANKSVRLFNYVVECLANGEQPDLGQLNAVGYLMRTTAVYGSGKFGAADHEFLRTRPEFAVPFQAEMLTVFLIRAFTVDLAEHMAHTKSPVTAVSLCPSLRRNLGVGNSTGLGLAPFIVNHPTLLNNWIVAREEALSRVRSLAVASTTAMEHFTIILARAHASLDAWHSEHPLQLEKLKHLKSDMAKLQDHVSSGQPAPEYPWDHLYKWAEENLTVEGQEKLVSLLLEPYDELVDGIATCMTADEATAFTIDGAQSLDELRAIIEDVYGWALQIDWAKPAHQARIWYISEEKLEPRLGERHDESIEPFEQPLAPGRDAAELHTDILSWRGEATVAAFALQHPQHRHIIRRAQIANKYPYAEIRDNTIDSNLLPIDLLRCKLSFFGATHFDPRSDRWVRINMFKNAPFPDELCDVDADNWCYPPIPETQS